LLRLEHTSETINHGWNHRLKDNFKLTVVFGVAVNLTDEVVEDADLLDAGMIFGTGFAPFRGGPMNFLSSRDDETTEESA